MVVTLGFPLLILLMALAAAGAFAIRVLNWQSGRAARVDWIAGLLAGPRRYLVDVHHVVARDPKTARMHMLAAGGLLAGSGVAALGALPALGRLSLWWVLGALAFAMMLAGALIEGGRRFPKRPARLSAGQFQLLPALLLGYGLGGFAVSLSAALGAPGALAGFLLAGTAACGLTLAWFAGRGPMRHALAGAVHLAVHPRPARFSGTRDVALAPEDLDAERLGVEGARGLRLEPARRLRRLRPMRPLRGRLPGLRRGPAAQSEAPDPGPRRRR